MGPLEIFVIVFTERRSLETHFNKWKIYRLVPYILCLLRNLAWTFCSIIKMILSDHVLIPAAPKHLFPPK